MSTVVVIGCPRSGTTLLRTMLDRNPGLHVHPHEPQFFRGLERRFGQNINDVERAIRYVSQHPYVASEMDEGRVREAFGGKQGSPVSTFISSYVETWASDHRDQVPVLKGPNWIYHLPRLEEWFNGLRVIHAIRDPRGSVSSQISRWPQFSVLQCAARWRRAIRAAKQWGADHPGQYIEVQYEDLLNSPEEPLNRLCDFMGVDYTELMLSFEQSEEQFEPGGKRTVNKLTKADPSRQSLWSKRLTEQQIGLIETWCAQEMRRLGYLSAPSESVLRSLLIPYLLDGSKGAVSELRNRGKEFLRIVGLRTKLLAD